MGDGDEDVWTGTVILTSLQQITVNLKNKGGLYHSYNCLWGKQSY